MLIPVSLFIESTNPAASVCFLVLNTVIYLSQSLEAIYLPQTPLFILDPLLSRLCRNISKEAQKKGRIFLRSRVYSYFLTFEQQWSTIDHDFATSNLWCFILGIDGLDICLYLTIQILQDHSLNRNR